MLVNYHSFLHYTLVYITITIDICILLAQMEEKKLIHLTAKPRLMELLKQRGWTQKQLAEKTGITQASISRFDRNTQVRHDHLFLIAHVLGVKAEDLFVIHIEEDGN